MPRRCGVSIATTAPAISAPSVKYSYPLRIVPVPLSIRIQLVLLIARRALVGSDV